MGVLKDALHLAVIQHLRTQRNNQTLVLSLNAPNGVGPVNIRSAWNALKENGKDEGMKKATGLQSVLRERLDIFHMHTNERGHNLITLTPYAQEQDPASGLPARGPAYNPPAPAVAAAPAALSGMAAADLNSLLNLGVTEEQASDPALFEEALKAVAELQAAEALNPGVIARASKEPKAKKQKTGTNYSVGATSKGGTKGKYGYQDIVWTPQLAVQNQIQKAKDAQLARALFNAAETHGGRGVTISQLGADYNVSSVKKDPQFKNHKLIDILRFHENVFELVPDSAIGGFLVNLQPGAGAALPDADTFLDEINEAELLLPERIENPGSQSQKMQALRIEVCHVIHKRGGKVQLNEIGQDQKIQKVKTGLPKTLKLIEFIKQFPTNFTVTPAAGGLMDVTLDSADCYDQSMIERNILRAQEMTQRFRDSKGKGKGGRDNPRAPQLQPSLGSGYDQQVQSHQALATASYLNTIMQQSTAGAYGAAGYPPQPGYPQGFSAPPPIGPPGSQGFGFGYSI